MADCLIQAGVAGPDNLILIAGTSDCILIAETQVLDGGGGAGRLSKSTSVGVQMPAFQKTVKKLIVKLRSTSNLAMPTMVMVETISALSANLKFPIKIVGTMKMDRSIPIRIKSLLKARRNTELEMSSKLKHPFALSIQSVGSKSYKTLINVIKNYAEIFNDRDIKHLALLYETLDKMNEEKFTKRTTRSPPKGVIRLRDVIQTVRKNRSDIVKSQTGGVDFKFPLIFRTQEDAKVDCKFCKTFNRREFDMFSPLRPVIPLHPNCRCAWFAKEGNRNLGQF